MFTGLQRQAPLMVGKGKRTPSAGTPQGCTAPNPRTFRFLTSQDIFLTPYFFFFCGWFYRLAEFLSVATDPAFPSSSRTGAAAADKGDLCLLKSV